MPKTKRGQSEYEVHLIFCSPLVSNVVRLTGHPCHTLTFALSHSHMYTLAHIHTHTQTHNQCTFTLTHTLSLSLSHFFPVSFFHSPFLLSPPPVTRPSTLQSMEHCPSFRLICAIYDRSDRLIGYILALFLQSSLKYQFDVN